MIIKKPVDQDRFFDGALGTTRTCDPQLRKLMLYPTELRAQNGEKH